MAKVITLGPTSGLYQPDYHLRFFRDGDPRRPIPASRVELNSTIAIQTSKSIGDLAGTWQVTLKDGRARHVLREMDTVRIKLRGHSDPRMLTVLNGVVDRVRAVGEADPYGSREDTIIEGRCTAKYLQVTSLFLPVWDPEALLPTALTFGLGDATKKVGGNRPYDIFRYLVRKYTYGAANNVAGLSGIPNSRYWLDHYTRFAKSLDFQIPYLQLDEDSVADALKRMEVLGFTETWVDELGRIVYRQPGWDKPVAYRLSTNELINEDLDRSDVDVSTYVEVIPAGDPGIDSATAQALRAGRAPVPSSYLTAAGGTQLGNAVDPSFVIATDAKGVPTKEGERNHWYQLQRRLGVRPQQITSPLIFTQEQAQAQAQGLLRFFSRMTKGGTVVIPGAPQVRLGYNLNLHGELDGVQIHRVFYIEAVQHSYVFGQSYTTTLTLTHGRDPWDPKWQSIILPRFDPSQLAQPDGGGGVLNPDGSGPGDPGSQTGNVRCDPADGDFKAQTTRPDGKRVLPNSWLSAFLAELAGEIGHTVYTNTYSRHPRLSSSNLVSDHWAGNAADVDIYHGRTGTQIAYHAFRLVGESALGAAALAAGGGTFQRYTWTWEGKSYSVQILWGANVDHTDHVHVGVRPA